MKHWYRCFDYLPRVATNARFLRDWGGRRFGAASLRFVRW